MNAQLPFSSATLSARRWPQVRFSSNSLTTSLAARWLSIALVSRRRSAISLEDGHRRRLRAAEVLAELLARELEEHRVDDGAHAGAARLVVEEGQLAEVLARADVLEDDGRRVLLGARQVDLHRAGLHDVHRRALVALREDDVARLEGLLGQARGERLAVLVGEALEERNLGEQVGGAHRSTMVARTGRRGQGSPRGATPVFR